ncbi:MAG: Epoxide hydrolase, partial [uncultured Pseudonocardia sp.]
AAVPRRGPRRRPRGPARAHRPHPLARARHRGGLEPGRAARLRARPRRPLAPALRLAALRGRAQRAAAVHHPARRRRRRLVPGAPPARPLPAPGRPAAAAHPRLARLGRGVPRPARRAHRPTRPARRLPPRRALAAGLRVQRQAEDGRVGRRADRDGLGAADGPPGLRALRRPRRRLGRRHHLGAGDGHAGQRRRHPPHAPDRAAPPGGVGAPADEGRGGGPGRPAHRRDLPHRLLRDPGHPAADPRLRARRLARGAVPVDRREVLGLDRLGRAAGERDRARPDARRRHALLAARHRRVVGAALLGELPAPPARPGRRPHRHHDLPQGAVAAAPVVAGAPLHRHPALEPAGRGRALPVDGAARRVRRRAARVLPPGAL